MAKGDIRRVAKEVGQELLQGARMVGKRVRRPKPEALRFAVTPAQFRPVQRPRPIKRKARRRR